MIFVGDDWAEAHAVVDEQGARLAKRRLPEGLDGIGQLHALVAEHAADPGEVVVGIETDRGLWVVALVEAGYQVYAVNPLHRVGIAIGMLCRGQRPIRGMRWCWQTWCGLIAISIA